jgi:hypothetical protein
MHLNLISYKYQTALFRVQLSTTGECGRVSLAIRFCARRYIHHRTGAGARGPREGEDMPSRNGASVPFPKMDFRTSDDEEDAFLGIVPAAFFRAWLLHKKGALPNTSFPSP